jgi:hypothetical protein
MEKKDFEVTWTFTALATSPEGAAKQAWQAMRAQHSSANMFSVFDEEGNETQVELETDRLD